MITKKVLFNLVLGAITIVAMNHADAMKRMHEEIALDITSMEVEEEVSQRPFQIQRALEPNESLECPELEAFAQEFYSSPRDCEKIAQAFCLLVTQNYELAKVAARWVQSDNDRAFRLSLMCFYFQFNEENINAKRQMLFSLGFDVEDISVAQRSVLKHQETEVACMTLQQLVWPIPFGFGWRRLKMQQSACPESPHCRLFQ